MKSFLAMYFLIGISVGVGFAMQAFEREGLSDAQKYFAAPVGVFLWPVALMRGQYLAMASHRWPAETEAPRPQWEE